MSDAMRMLKKEVGGSLALRFTNKDVYNALPTYKRKNLGNTDSNTLIGKLNQRKLKIQTFTLLLNLMKERVSLALSLIHI